MPMMTSNQLWNESAIKNIMNATTTCMFIAKGQQIKIGYMMSNVTYLTALNVFYVKPLKPLIL